MQNCSDDTLETNAWQIELILFFSCYFSSLLIHPHWIMFGAPSTPTEENRLYNAIQQEDNPCFSVQIAHKTSKTFSNLRMAFQSSKRVFSAASLCKKQKKQKLIRTHTRTCTHSSTPGSRSQMGPSGVHSFVCVCWFTCVCVCVCPKRTVSPRTERDHSALVTPLKKHPEAWIREYKHFSRVRLCSLGGDRGFRGKERMTTQTYKYVEMREWIMAPQTSLCMCAQWRYRTGFISSSSLRSRRKYVCHGILEFKQPEE